MYSTLDGAKKCAKQLKHILERSGLAYPLAKCQAAVARAGGYGDWHDLTRRIGRRVNSRIPYDHWGALISSLPVPCHLPITSYLRDEFAAEAADEASTKFWIRDTLPYLVGLEVVHRSTTPLLRPGSGKDQRICLQIVSGMLLDIKNEFGFAPKLDPETLTAIFGGTPDAILPRLARHPRFDEAIKALIAGGILKVEGKTTRLFSPDSEELHTEIIRQARAWNLQKEPEIKYVQMSPELAAAFQRQSDIDRKEAGPKVPYDTLDYRGVSLQSRYSVASEFETMKAVVDAMPNDVRLRLTSIWCDSKACAYYHVVVTLGMHRSALTDQIRECFLAATSGFNGLSVEHGSHETLFDPEWPADEAYFAELEEKQQSMLK